MGLGRFCISGTLAAGIPDPISVLTRICALKIDTWIVSPYKKPERDLPDNEVFNNHVSMVRIRSEHAIGYLKGRFHSLKNLRIKIKDKTTHILATYWIAACIGVHAFAMQCEEQEQRLHAGDRDDPFIAEGLSSSDSDIDPPAPSRVNTHPTRLREGKTHRENLKMQLFRSKARRVRYAARLRAERHGLELGGLVVDSFDNE